MLRELVNNDMSGYQRNRGHTRAGLWRQLRTRGSGAPAWQLHQRVVEEAGPVEDERRLFYVGCTRAREQLYLIHPPDPRLERQEQMLGSRVPPPHLCIVSRFLYEARPKLSRRVGAALGSDADTVPVAHAPGLVNRYLQAVDAGFKVEGLSKRGRGTSSGG